MTITPYNTPLQYEYKPLNLMAFAAPLSKMQEEFDLVTSAVDQADFDITHLPFGTDPERAKELIKTVEGKRDELAKNLAETKNYKQAATKLKELNTLWQEDPELTALQSNYKKYVDDVQLAKDNVKSGHWNQTYADQWLNRAKREYTGANFTADYNNPEGDYTVFGRNPRVKDIQKDFDELAYKVASAVPGETREGTLKELGIDQSIGDKKFLQEIIDEKDAGVVTKRVSAYLKTLPQYEEFFKEKADYDFADIKADPNLYKAAAQSLNNDYISNLDSEINQIKKAAKKDKSLLTNPDYLNLLEEREAAVTAKNTGDYNETAIKNLYEKAYLEDAYDMTALGKVFAYKNVKRDYSWRDLAPPEDEGGLAGKLAKLGVSPSYVPSGDELIDFTTLDEQRNKASWGLKGSTEKIGKLAGGAVGRITIGTAKDPLYQRTKNNQALIWDNQQKLLKVLTESGGNIKTIIAKGKEAGLKITEGDAKRLANTFGNGEAIRDYEVNLEGGRSNRNVMTNASSVIDNSLRSSASNGYFKNLLGTVGSNYVDYEMGPSTTPRSKSAIEGLGVISEGNIGRGHGKTWDEYAKERGYANLQAAVAAGEYFEDVKPGAIKGLFKLSNAMGGGEKVMGTNQRLVQNPESANYLQSAIRNSTDVLNLGKPALYNTWEDVPGFRPGDTNAQVDYSSGKDSQLVHDASGKTFFSVPMTYLEDGKKKQGTWLIDPSAGTSAKVLNILSNVSDATRNTGNADLEQTHQTSTAAIYDIINPNSTINEYVIKSTPVTPGAPSVIDVLTMDRGQNIIVEKNLDSEGGIPKLKVAMINPTTGEKAYVKNPSTNKIWNTEADQPGAAQAVKYVIMGLLGQ